MVFAGNGSSSQTRYVYVCIVFFLFFVINRFTISTDSSRVSTASGSLAIDKLRSETNEAALAQTLTHLSQVVDKLNDVSAHEGADKDMIVKLLGEQKVILEREEVLIREKGSLQKEVAQAKVEVATATAAASAALTPPSPLPSLPAAISSKLQAAVSLEQKTYASTCTAQGTESIASKNPTKSSNCPSSSKYLSPYVTTDLPLRLTPSSGGVNPAVVIFVGCNKAYGQVKIGRLYSGYNSFSFSVEGLRRELNKRNFNFVVLTFKTPCSPKNTTRPPPKQQFLPSTSPYSYS